jgi:hypothetical protein
VTSIRIRFWPQGASRDAAEVVTVDLRDAGELGGWRAQLPVYTDGEFAEFYDVEQLTEDEPHQVVARATATLARIVGRQKLVLRSRAPFQPV